MIQDAEVRYENTVAIDPARLEAIIDGRSLAQLVELGRHRSAQLLALLGRLDRERLEREVPCMIRDGGTIAFEGAVRWGRLLLDVQPGVHLANHIEQLRALRR